MALPESGSISFGDINVELGRSSTATISINQAEAGTYSAINQESLIKPNGNTPNSMSEWRGYDHSATGSPNPVNYKSGTDCFVLTDLFGFTSTIFITANVTKIYDNSMSPLAAGNYIVLAIDSSVLVEVDSVIPGLIISVTSC